MDIKHIHFETIDSTNTWAKTHTENLSPDKLTVISADHQLGGRGRFNRSWISPPHKNLISTFCFFSEFPDIRNIPQILALSALELLEEHGLKAALKWPNDINAGPKKMGGILAETSAEESGLWCFIGIGLNINMTQEDALLIDRPATSLFIETGKEASLPFLVSRLPLLFRANLETYKQKGLAPFILKLKNSMIHKVGDLISINKSEGAFLKIDDEGSLVIEINGKEVTFMSGEIH